MNFSSISNFNWSGSWDWIIIFVFLAVAFVYGLSMGRNRLIVLILGTFFSFIIIKNFPWAQLSFIGIEFAPDSVVQIFIFLAIILGFFFLIPYSALGSAIKLRGRGRSSWWQAFILSILQIGLILSIVVNLLESKITDGLSPLAKIIFVSDPAQFIWLFLPILAIMFFRRKRHEIEV